LHQKKIITEYIFCVTKIKNKEGRREGGKEGKRERRKKNSKINVEFNYTFMRGNKTPSSKNGNYKV